MSATKRRTKKYVPRQIAMPRILDVRMTADEHPALALELHLAIVNLIGAAVRAGYFDAPQRAKR